jgi:short-subunit dehydrogenase
MTESVIITGGSSGIGEALARRMAEEGYEVGITARRLERLKDVARDLPTKSYVARMDVTDVERSREVFDALAAEMGGVDIVVLNAGIGPQNPDRDWETDRDTIDTNARGFAALATAAIDHFEDRGEGQLVGISSVAAHLGLGDMPAYSGSKAFVSTYLEGLRAWALGRDVDLTVTTIEPGYVETPLANDGFWKCSLETAIDQLYPAIRDERTHAYIPRRWKLVALALAVVPDSVVRRVTQNLEG